MNQPSRRGLLWIHVQTEFELDKIKFFSIGMLFIFFGFTAIMAQLFLPQLLQMSDLDIINLPDPTIISVLMDYWGDIAFLSMLIVIITSSTFSSELDINKSGYFYLARPISRDTYYLTRFLLRTFMISMLFFAASLVTYFYSTLFFDAIDISKIFIATILVSLNVGAVAAVVMALSTRFNSMQTGLIGIVIILLQLVISLVEWLRWFSPFALANLWVEVLVTTVEPVKISAHILVLMAWIIVPGLSGLLHYKRRDLI